MKKEQEEFQNVICYEFQDPELLKRALTHSSYANEVRNGKVKDNERLEFLGDAVLEIVSSDYLYRKYESVSEGELSKMRASMVCEQTLALCAQEIGLGDYLYLGKGEDQTGGRKRPSILSDALEATIGAVYLDGGFEQASAYIHRCILNDIENKQLFHDSKTKLQEYVQARWTDPVVYTDNGFEGPEHNRTFYVNLEIGGKKISEGSGHSKKAAEQEAAYRALLFFHHNKETQ